MQPIHKPLPQQLQELREQNAQILELLKKYDAVLTPQAQQPTLEEQARNALNLLDSIRVQAEQVVNQEVL